MCHIGRTIGRGVISRNGGEPRMPYRSLRFLLLLVLPALLALSLLTTCTGKPDEAGAGKTPKSVRTHCIASGDSLWSIAEQHYGNGKKYWEIIESANKDKLGSGGLLKVGDVLVIPEIPGVAFLPEQITATPPPSEIVDFIKTKPNVSLSAKGWTIKPRPPRRPHPTTIVVNPAGQEFNIGETAYPDIHETNIWIVEVKELNAKFLLIHVPPACSASVPMPVLYIDNDNCVTLAATIQQRFEFKPQPDDEPGFNPRINFDGTTFLRDMLFKDSDGDGIRELVENDCWKDGGTMTYFKFTEQKKFVPLWKETYDRDDKLVSRERVQ
jgi:nitrogen fixation protein